MSSEGFLVGLLWAWLGLAFLFFRGGESWLRARLAWPGWAAGNVVLKSGLVMAWMSPSLCPEISAWIWTFLVTFSVLALTLLLSSRLGAVGCWAFAALASALFWGDLLYYRSFGDFLAVSHFVYLGESHHQGPSQAAQLQLLHLFRPQDLFLALDLLFALPLALMARGPKAPSGRTRWLGPVLPLALVVFGHGLWLVWASPWLTNQMKNRLYNWTHVKKRGLVAYHLYDAAHWLGPRLQAPEPIADEVIRRRLALSRDSAGPAHAHYAAAQGSNVLMIQLESLQYFVVGMEIEGQEVTPFLNRLRRQSLYAEALDQTAGGSTSDTMLLMLNSLHPPSGGPFCFLFPTNSTRALPRILSEQGYSTLHVMSYDGAFWNTRVMAEYFGFERQLFSPDLPPPGRGELVGWDLGDAPLFERLMPLLTEQPQPFFCYVTTTMMHYPFLELRPHQKLLELPGHLEGTMAGRYLQLARYRDSAVELLVARLQEAGLWENTVLLMCGDHRARMDEAEYRRLEIPEAWPLRNRLPLFIHLPGDSPQGELPPLVGQIDVAPTLLHLLGLTDVGTAFLGRNALAGPHASASVYGNISDGVHLLWSEERPEESRFESLAEGVPGDPESPLARELYLQLNEETRVSDTLIYGNRVTEFAR